MTALRVEDRNARQGSPRLRAVPSESPRTFAPAVRPDRPNSRRGGLHAVASAPSADLAGPVVRWSTAPAANRPAIRRGERVAAPRQQAARARDLKAHDLKARDLKFDNAVKVVLALVGMALSFALGIFLFTALGFGLQAGDVITVVSGDTLWSIAASIGVDVPTAQVVQDIAELNALETSTVVAGTELVLPAY